MPSTKFRSWILDFGVGELAGQLRALDPRAGCSRQTVYRWLNGEMEPRRERRAALVRLAGGALTVADVLEHFDVTRPK